MEPASDIPLSLWPLFLQVPALSSSAALVALIGICLLLVCSALISGSEVAFFSLTHHDLEALQEEKSPTAKNILYLKERPRILLATILISNNFVNVSIVILADLLLRYFLPPELMEQWALSTVQWFGYDAVSADNSIARILNFFITVIAVTFLLLLFGEVAPKVYATQQRLQLARLMAQPLRVLAVVFRPLSFLLARSTHHIERRLERHVRGGTSKKEIGEAIELTVSRDKDTAREELDILHSIVKFGGVAVKQIMTSRMDIVALENTASYKEVLAIARKSGYSRIPVYEEDLDNIVGILYVKDLLGHLQEPDNFAWQPLVRTNVFYVPESKKIDDLLREFQRQHLHMAIVVDEYGGTAGLVTLEDIMEEIIGDIKDEFDDESEVEYQKIDDHNYLFEGKTLLTDLCRITGIPLEDFEAVRGEADSLAGLLLELCGQLPRKDAVIHHNSYTFRIVSVSKRRIEQVRLTIP